MKKLREVLLLNTMWSLAFNAFQLERTLYMALLTLISLVMAARKSGAKVGMLQTHA